MSDVDAWSAGWRLGPYLILSRLGGGDTGEVYKVWDGYREREVALKLLAPHLSREPEMVARFRADVERLIGLDHPSIATLHALEEIDGNRFLVMELTAGRRLSSLLGRKRYSPAAAVEVISQVAAALESAHRQYLIHGDLRPAHIKIAEDGSVKIYDFGLMRAIETLETGTSSKKETVERPGSLETDGCPAIYLSPEQLKGRADERSDIWSLGVILWEMLAGSHPFARGSISDCAHAILHDEPEWDELPEEVPAHVKRMLLLCLQKRPVMRLRNAGDVLVELMVPLEERSTRLDR